MVEGMPLIRKIIDVERTSKAVILPKSWLEYFEKGQGCKIEQVAIEVDHELKIFQNFRYFSKHSKKFADIFYKGFRLIFSIDFLRFYRILPILRAEIGLDNSEKDYRGVGAANSSMQKSS